MSETTLTTPSAITPLQSMLHELYALRELWTNAAFTTNTAYTGGSAKFTLDASFNLTYTGGTFTFNGGNISVTAGSFTVSGGDITTTGARNISVAGSGGLGYATGSGGSVTQITSKSTSVTLNKTNGRILTHNASLAGGAMVAFGVANSTVAATDTVIVNLQDAGGGAHSVLDYQVWAGNASAGAFTVAIKNNTGGAIAEVLTLNFAVIKAVTS